MKKPVIAVLMSTYNGEKFLREQIDSILNQKDINVELLIRDDGSIDSTRKILQEYINQHDNIKVILDENIGVGRSFMILLRNCQKADYYAFSDQDDVWLEDKLIRAVTMIREAEAGIQTNNTEKAVLYTSNQIIVDQNCNGKELRFNSRPKLDMMSSIATNVISGCTMVMNNALRKLLIHNDKIPEERILNIRLHDTWIMIVANAVGTVLYDEESRILYRQHSDNVVGIREKKGIAKIIDKRNRLITGKYKGIRSLCAKELFFKYNIYLSEEEKNILKLIMESHSFIGAYRISQNKRLRVIFDEGRLMLFLRSLWGWL